MKELFILLAPRFWSLRNDIIRFERSFYKKLIFYIGLGGIFIFLITRLLSLGMAKLQNLSPDVFNLLLVKGYSLIFIIIFFIQIINGFVLALNTYYQSRELEVLFTSPVNRTSLFFSRLLETHIRASWMLIIFGIPLLVSSGLLYHAKPFYFIYSLALFLTFSIIPVNIGIGAAIFTASVFHVGKFKKFLFSGGIIAAALLLTLLRLFKPERLVTPELFANLTLFISELKAPAFILLPNRWLSEAIFNFLGKAYSMDTLIFISLLFLTSYITTVFLEMVFRRRHYRGWGLLQEGGVILKGKGPHAPRMTRFTKVFQRFTKMLEAESRMLLSKDLLCQLRDTKNIHQILILLSLIIIYLFSIASLPLNWEGYSVQLRYMISFFNLGLILIIIASLCSRLVYRAVVSEGSSLWILKTSPMTPGRYVRTKFLFFFIPLFIIGQLLTISTSFFIGIEKPMILLKSITAAVVTFSLVSMSIAFGISELRYATGDSVRDAKAGSAIQMISSVSLILFTLALEIIPIFLYFLKEAEKAAFTRKAWLMIGGVVSVLFLANLCISAISMHLSIKRYEKLQLS